MTMLGFRADDEARQAQERADALGIDKSELIREALHRHLVRLASEHDAAAWEREPLTVAEADLARGVVTPAHPGQVWPTVAAPMTARGVLTPDRVPSAVRRIGALMGRR